MNLSLLVFVPLVTAVGVLFCKGLKQVRTVSLIGAIAQLILATILLVLYWQQRGEGNTAMMLFESNYSWFTSLNINFHTGVDGISVAMILLTSFVVIAGVLVSWTIESMSKEFFFLLILLSVGAYGFFISLDLFTLFSFSKYPSSLNSS